MARLIPTKSSLRVELARARLVWPDIKRTQEFWVGLWLFVSLAVGVGVLGLAFKFR
jgi:hypothetical protein